VKRAFVLGGSTYLGRAVVGALVDAGVAVAATARRPTDLPGAQMVALDAADGAAVRRTFAALCAEHGAPEVFVHCLTVGRPRALAEITDDEWREAHEVNVRSAFLACQELAPRMAERGGGDLILTAALDGIQPVPAPAHFAASQAALLGLTRALAKELGPAGVRINLVVLGVLEGGVASTLPAPLLESYRRFSALGRAGTADEVARAVRWLALENRYMTGQIVSLTGGL